jgi:hypothetical protein
MNGIVSKKEATPLNQVARGAFGAQLNFWRQRMNGADIADVYYPALINGEESTEYPVQSGEKVRESLMEVHPHRFGLWRKNHC